MNFNILSKPAIIFGEDKIYTLPDELNNRNLKRAMLVVTPHFVNNGLAANLQGKLKEAGIESVVYSNLIQDAPDFTVNNGAQIARDFKADTIVAIGGGKAMDTAKGINIIVNNPGKTIADYLDPSTLPSRNPGAFLILCPTTTGTGSEMTFASVIHFMDTDRKLSVGDGTAFANLAIVDPVLTVELPKDVTACPSMKELNYTEEQLECISELTPQAVGSLLSPRHVTKEEVLALLHDAMQR